MITTSSTATALGMARDNQATSGCTRLAMATAASSPPMTRVDASTMRTATRVAPRRATAAMADRDEMRSRSVGCGSAMARYSTDVVDAGDAPEPAADAVPMPSSVRTVDLDWRSIAVLLGAFVALIALTGLVRSAPRTLTALIIGGLLALALNPLVEATQRRLGGGRPVAIGIVLSAFFLSVVALVALLGPPAVHQAQSLSSQLPRI